RQGSWTGAIAAGAAGGCECRLQCGRRPHRRSADHAGKSLESLARKIKGARSSLWSDLNSISQLAPTPARADSSRRRRWQRDAARRGAFVSKNPMKLPNAENAFIDIAKLRDYCLNPNHPEGKHKARAFLEKLGLGRSDAELLRKIILEGILKA